MHLVQVFHILQNLFKRRNLLQYLLYLVVMLFSFMKTKWHALNNF